MKKPNNKQAFVMLVATMVSTANFIMVAFYEQLSSTIILLDAILSGTIITLLWVSTVPLLYRLVPTLAIVCSFLIAASRADFFSIGPSRERIDSAVFPGETFQSASSGSASSGAQSGFSSVIGTKSNGAMVRFTTGKEGSDWARLLNAKLDRQVGGMQASDVSITGSASANGPLTALTVSVTWRVALRTEIAECGRTSVIGSDDRILIEQISRPIQTSIERTVETKKPTCF